MLLQVQDQHGAELVLPAGKLVRQKPLLVV